MICLTLFVYRCSCSFRMLNKMVDFRYENFLLGSRFSFEAYRISSNKRRASDKRHPLIRAAPLDIHIEINVSLLINAAHLNDARTGIISIFF